MEEKGCIQIIVVLSSGPVNSLILGILTRANDFTSMGIHFVLPFASMILSVFFSVILLILLDIKNIARSKKPSEDEYQKKYGRHAVMITIIVFLLGGLITSVRASSFYTHLLLYGVVGFAWGMLWLKMFQKGYFNLDENTL